MPTWCARRAGAAAGRRWPGPAELRGRRGLHQAIDLDEGLTGHVLRVVGSFEHREDRTETRGSVLRQPHPLVPVPGPQRRGIHLFESRPLLGVVLRWEVGGEPEQVRVEPGFEGTDGHETTVSALVGVVERRPGVYQVGALLEVPGAGAGEPVECSGEDRCPLGHGGVDHLTHA